MAYLSLRQYLCSFIPPSVRPSLCLFVSPSLRLLFFCHFFPRCYSSLHAATLVQLPQTAVVSIVYYDASMACNELAAHDWFVDLFCLSTFQWHLVFLKRKVVTKERTKKWPLFSSSIIFILLHLQPSSSSTFFIFNHLHLSSSLSCFIFNLLHLHPSSFSFLIILFPSSVILISYFSSLRIFSTFITVSKGRYSCDTLEKLWYLQGIVRSKLEREEGKKQGG